VGSGRRGWLDGNATLDDLEWEKEKVWRLRAIRVPG
jgi:hypothetical protein